MSRAAVLVASPVALHSCTAGKTLCNKLKVSPGGLLKGTLRYLSFSAT